MLALAVALLAVAVGGGIAAIYVVYSTIRRMELALDDRNGAELVGQLCIVNTPAPDDQSIRGVVRQICAGGGLILAAAHYLEGDGTALAVGEVYVPRVAWVQVGVEPDALKPETPQAP